MTPGLNCGMGVSRTIVSGPRLSPQRSGGNAMRIVALGALVALSLVSTSVIAQPKYGPGTSATEIKVGQTIAYSGPASAYGQLGKAEDAYFKWLNAKGGINGRKITFITLDDGYSPPKAVENARKLVESEQVA